MNCLICKSNTTEAFKAKVLDKYEAKYNFCKCCGYLFAIQPDWLAEAYKNPIAEKDIGLVSRNISISSKLAALLYFGIKPSDNRRYLDIAGGYGLLTRMMRDFGFNFYWEDKYCQNIFAVGYENQEYQKYDLITAFEVIEHVVDPISFIKEALNTSGAETIIFSTVLFEGQPPDPKSWWYYGFGSGQHIGFFQKKTLEKIASELSLNFASANNIHIFSKRKISDTSLRILTNNLISRLFSVWIRFRVRSKNPLIDKNKLL